MSEGGDRGEKRKSEPLEDRELSCSTVLATVGEELSAEQRAQWSRARSISEHAAKALRAAVGGLPDVCKENVWEFGRSHYERRRSSSAGPSLTQLADEKERAAEQK